MRTSSIATPTTTLTAQEQELWAAWQARVHRYRAGDTAALPPEVIGLGSLRVFGRAGDAVMPFPRVRMLSDLDSLPADVQLGMQIAERTVTAYRTRGIGRMIYSTAPAIDGRAPEPKVVDTIDPTRDLDILIVAPIAGGR